MSELKPVAYLVSQEPYSSARYILCDKPVPIDNKKITPLYTKEQLQPRVTMTKKDAEKWDKFYKEYRGRKFRLVLEKLETDGRYIEFYQRFAYNAESVAVFARMFAEYNPEHPEETIEIFPDKKWFVRSKRYKDYFLHVTEDFVSDPYTNRGKRKAFDTKEQAEEWVNPLTEAVLLPVED